MRVYLVICVNFVACMTFPHWSWVAGKSYEVRAVKYGTLGVPGDSDPGGRQSFSDAVLDDCFFIFGGIGWSPPTDYYYRGDVFSFNTTSMLWTWVAGSSVINAVSKYGSLGVPSSEIYPGARTEYNFVNIKDSFYLFGGRGYVDGLSFRVFLGDLWLFQLNTSQWTLLHDTQVPKFGSFRVFSNENNPGRRIEARMTVWRNSLCLYSGLYDDMWEYDTALRQWAWIHGSNETARSPVYGELLVFDSNHTPGRRRYFDIVTHRDSIFLYGGRTMTSKYPFEAYSDFWEYSMMRKMWRWVSGKTTYSAPASHGAIGVKNSTNTPGSRTDHRLSVLGDNIILYGGRRNQKEYSDLWEYSVSEDLWIWIAGTSILNSVGSFDENAMFPPGMTLAHLSIVFNQIFVYGGRGINNGLKYRNTVWKLRNGCLRSGDSWDGENCTRCTPGSLPSSIWCVGCDSGSYSSDPEDRSCESCLPGMYADTGATVCSQCVPGTFISWKACQNCSRGTFSNKTNSESCMQCYPGFGSVSGGTLCDQCQKGWFSNETTNGCQPCDPGRISNITKATSCIQCDPGFFSGLNSTVCDMCPIGSFSNFDTIHCETCVPGRYSPELAASVCKTCPGGKISNFTGSSICVSCMPGWKYTTSRSWCEPCELMSFSSDDSGVCTPCPSNYFNERIGSTFCDSCQGVAFINVSHITRRSQCACAEGFYGTPYITGGCRPCNLKSDCPINSSLPYVPEGYFRSRNDPAVFFECIPKESCAFTGNSALSECSQGYFGEQCGECSPGDYYRDGWYCVECRWYSRIGILGFFLIIFFVLYVNLQNATTESSKINAIAIAFSWFQILSIIKSRNSQWPALVQWIFSLSSILNLDLDMASPECSFPVDFWSKWHVKMTSPLVVGSIQILFFVLQERYINSFYIWNHSLIDTFKHFFKSLVFTCEGKKLDVPKKPSTPKENVNSWEDGGFNGKDLFVLYPFRRSRFVYSFCNVFSSLYVLLASTSLEMFQCTQQLDGTYLMGQNANQHCFDSYWYQVLLSNIVFSVYALVAFPVYVLWVLRSKGNDLEEEELEQNYGPFIRPYRQKVWWWPVFEFGLRFCLVLSSEVVGFYSLQIGNVISISLIIVYIALLYRFEPYEKTLNTGSAFLYVSCVLRKVITRSWSVFVALILASGIVYEASPASGTLISVFVLLSFVAVVFITLLSVKGEIGAIEKEKDKQEPGQ